MKKSILLGISIFITVIILSGITVVLLKNNDNINKEAISIIEKTYNLYPDDVDSAVQYFMNSEEYKKMNKDKQVEDIGTLLELYQKNGVIKNLYYDESTPMYSFTYNNGDIKGVLGGVMLKDWHPMMN